jgi:hypothetical protein
MQIRFAIALYFMLVVVGFAAEPTITIRPIQITSSDKLPESATEIQPFGFQSDIVQITYLVEGKGLIGIKDKSLQIDNVLTKEGKDLIKTDGKSIAEMDPFGGRVNKDGTCILFTTYVKKNEFQKTDGLKLKGDVVVLVGTKKETANGEFKTDKKSTIEVGPYKISNSVEGSKKDSAIPLPGFGPQGDQMTVTVKGKTQSIIAFKLMDGDKALESNGSFSSSAGIGGEETSYFFSKPSKGSVKVIMSYWKDMKEQKVSIDTVKQK